MFTDSFKKYLLIAVSIVLIITILVVARTKRVTPAENMISAVTIPVQKVFVNVNNWFSKQFTFIKQIGKLKEENEKLRDEIDKLKLDNSTYQTYKDANEELRVLLEIKRKNILSFVCGASVVGVDPSNVSRVYIIDRGTKDGLSKDMVVINSDGLVGRIFEVGSNHSKVISIIDDRMVVGAEVVRTKQKVIVNGDNVNSKNSAFISNITVESDLLEGDEISTSNTSIVFPEGITIGRVEKIFSDNNDLTKSARVKPAVDFDKAKYVLVIKNKEMVEAGIEELLH